MIGECVRPNTTARTFFLCREGRKSIFGVFAAGGLQRIGFVRNPTGRDAVLHFSIALIVGEWAFRRIHGKLMEIGRSESRQLRIQIREQAALKEWVVAEVDTGNDVRR